MPFPCGPKSNTNASPFVRPAGMSPTRPTRLWDSDASGPPSGVGEAWTLGSMPELSACPFRALYAGGWPSHDLIGAGEHPASWRGVSRDLRGSPPVSGSGGPQTMTAMAGTSGAGWRGTVSVALFWLRLVGRYVRGASGLSWPARLEATKGLGGRTRTRARPATPGTIRGDYPLESGTTQCMVPACLRRPAGHQDLSSWSSFTPSRACR